MKFYWLIVLFAWMAPASAAQPRNYSETDVVSYAQGLDVRSLDPKLSSEPLDKWLRSGPPHVRNLFWQISFDCDERLAPGETLKDSGPLCVRFGFERHGAVNDGSGWGLIQVGTVGEGVSGPPHLLGIMAGQSSTRLSDLVRLLNKRSSIPTADKKVLDYAKKVDVHLFDPTLPSQALDEWLRSGHAHLDTIICDVSRDCDLKQGFEIPNHDDWPLCVRVGFRRGSAGINVGGLGMIVVGTLGKGVSGLPRFLSFSAGKLSELPQFLDKAESQAKRGQQNTAI